MGVMDGLSLVRQCALAGVSRSSLYYSPAGESAENLAPVREIDEVHLKYPFHGVRQMRSHLRLGGVVVGVDRVRRLMRVMGSGAVQPPPRTSSPAPGHKVYPYLLGRVRVCPIHLPIWSISSNTSNSFCLYLAWTSFAPRERRIRKRHRKRLSSNLMLPSTQ